MTRLTLDWLHLIALLGALQGILLAGVLALKPSNRTANRLLAILVAAFSVHLATTVYHAAGLVERFPHFFGVGYPLLFLYGPLVYLYAITASDRDRRLEMRDAAHFLPFALVVLFSVPNYALSGAEKIAFLGRIQQGEMTLLMRVAEPSKFVSGVAYAAATIAFLRRHREQVKASYSTLERVNLRWLLWLGGGAAAIWVVALVFNLLATAGFAEVARADDIVSLAIAVMVYGIGYLGLRQPEIFRYETSEYAVPVTAEPVTAEPVNAMPVAPSVADVRPETPSEPASPRYERSGLSDRQAERLKGVLTDVMEKERPWRNPDLTLAHLAERLGTTPHKLSEVLNSHFGQTFYDFVNGYRVREVQRRIAVGDAERMKILSLALDAGFASKSTFNVVFKKHTNQTPSTYRQSASS
jgi:AraC-like DNA-binding protein